MGVVVTGGAGYIGAHVVRELRAQNIGVAVVDDLSTGLRERVRNVPLLRADLTNRAAAHAVATFMREHQADTVVHMAALKHIEHSMGQPVRYFRDNVTQLANTLDAMQLVGARRLILASSAAVYGDASSAPVTEEAPTEPTNPYGASKLACEHLVRWAAWSNGLTAVSLRYFNVSGAAPRLHDRHGAGLISRLAAVANDDAPFAVLGADYPTHDGTCVRDHVHVVDLARAHVAALDVLTRQAPGTHRIFNVGTGIGTSVGDAVAALRRLFPELRVDVTYRARRAGDPAHVVADATAFARATGWRPEHRLEHMLMSLVDRREPEGQTFAPFSFDIELEPGAYTVTVGESDPSDGQGASP